MSLCVSLTNEFTFCGPLGNCQLTQATLFHKKKLVDYQGKLLESWYDFS